MDEMTLYDYLAYGSEKTKEDAVNVIEDFGYIVTIRNEADLAECLRQFAKREGHKGLLALAMVHPDRELILDSANQSMNADGSASATPAPAPTTLIKQKDHSHHTTLALMGIIGVIAALSIVAIVKK